MIPSILTRPLDFPRPSCSKIDIEENIAERSLVDARAPRDEAAKATPRSGADHIVPDCARQNFCAIDRRLRDLLPLHLAPEDFSHLEQHFDRLGRLAGRRLDELACVADKRRPCSTRATTSAATRAQSTITARVANGEHCLRRFPVRG
jgi:hypothetical protein